MSEYRGDHTARLAPQIDAALKKYVSLPEGCPDRLRQAIEYSLLGPGKRLRPILVLMAAEACGGTIQAAMPAACAVEMIHAYSLVHDDLPAMDDDDLRRGRPTCHKVFGEAMAILAGDALLTLAFQVLAEGVRPPEVAAACSAALARAAGPCRLVGGQADDIDVEKGDRSNLCGAPEAPLCGKLDLSPFSLLESIHDRKTGAMIRVSIRLGGMTARAPQRQLAALDDYGRRLGLAFQVTDDLLDVRSNLSAAGKRVGKDAAKGKLTFPGLIGVDASAAYAAQLIHEACEALGPLGPRAESLSALARTLLERNR
ncbi:MAG: polyprenyl synthetase family protein [Thermoguttaceae bacterium]